MVTGSAGEVLRIVGSLDTDIVPASDGGGSCIGCCYSSVWCEGHGGLLRMTRRSRIHSQCQSRELHCALFTAVTGQSSALTGD